MLTRLLRRTLTVTAAVAFITVPSLACAHSLSSPSSPIASSSSALNSPSAAAAVTPGWRIVRFLPGAVMGGLSVPGRRDAWLAGEVCGADSLCNRVFVRRWDGTAWRTVTLPKTVTATMDEAGIGAVAASSASNVWVFDLRGTGSVNYTTALHWTGKGWATPARLAADIAAAVAPSASDAWAFGAPASNPQGGYIAHFNGKSWSHAAFPVQVQDVSALSADDIWVGGAASGAAGSTPTASVVIERWNGRAWHETPVPSLDFPPNAWTGVSVTAATPRDVWAEVGAQGNGTQTSYLLHWNGKAWRRVAFFCPGSLVSRVTADGHGGIWLASATDPFSSGPVWFCHDTGGHWTRTAVPKRAGRQPAIDDLAWIPGTRSLWATGGFDADAGEAIFKYGP